MSDEAKLREAIDNAHKRNRFWMILFPLILTGLVVVGLITWLAINGNVGGANVENLAGVATVLLALLTFLFGLITLALIIGLIIGVIKLYEFLPQAGKTLRDYLRQAQHYLRVAGDAAVKPIVELHAFTAKIRQIGASLTNRFSQKG